MFFKLHSRPLFKFLKCLKSIQTHSKYYCKESQITKSNQVVQEKWEEKVKFWMKKYEDIFGLTRLSEMHEKVLEHQNKVQITQEKRRKAQEEIFIVQKKLQEMQDILHKTSMGDDMYISVVTQVRELLKEQKRLQDVFSLYDQTEKEQQTSLALAINNSQDHERTYREKNKYLSLITGVVGGLLGILGSSINNWRHRKDIKNFADDILNQVIDLQKMMEKISSTFTLDKHIMNISESELNEDEVKSENLIAAAKVQHELLNESIRSLKTLMKDTTPIPITETNVDLQLKEILDSFEVSLESKLNNYSSVNVGIVSVLLLFGMIFTYFSSNR